MIKETEKTPLSIIFAKWEIFMYIVYVEAGIKYRRRILICF